MARTELYLRIFLFCFIFASAYSLMLSSQYSKWYGFRRLAQAGKQTFAEVTAKEPWNHSCIRYKFEVDSVSYSGSGNGSLVGLRFEAIHVGNKILVTYSPENPRLSVIGDPNALYHSWTTGLFVVLPLFILIGAAYVAFSRRLWDRKR
jgi:hypothetical protein